MAEGTHPRTAAFEANIERYDRWYEEHQPAYRAELDAVRRLLPAAGSGLEIGVGTGRFAAPLGVGVGLDPSLAMLHYARRRGVAPVCGVAEALPFADATFDYVLSVTVICFVGDPRRMLFETHRVLKPQGAAVIGFIDRASPLGHSYEARKNDDIFYRDAVFRSAGEIEILLGRAGFGALEWLQTLSAPPGAEHEAEPPRPGYGEGGFVVVGARRD